MDIPDQEIAGYIDARLDEVNDKLREVNLTLHSNPELAFEEHIAHDTICDFLEGLGYKVTRHAYGLDTSFEAIYGTGGRLVNINAEFDALPGGGHMCGHNLISTCSLAAFIALTAVLEKTKAPGRVQLLGTPAEEDGGGKALLIKAGAFENVCASVMAHPSGIDKAGHYGYANSRVVAAQHTTFEYQGKSAHAGAFPWDGINALDAFVALYNNVSLLRQQIKPNERMSCCLLEGPKVANMIPEYTKINFTARSVTLDSLKALVERVDNCAQAASLATGCTLKEKKNIPYADLICPQAMNDRFMKHMKDRSFDVGDTLSLQASTDQGNVSHVVPSLHSIFCLEEAGDSNPHQKPFAKVAAGYKAHLSAVNTGKGLAQTTYDLLVDDSLLEQARSDWKKDIEERKNI
jgi:amidohydrolase